jgi:putative ABC transport system permease protein
MTIRKLIIQSLKHYSGSAIATSAGIAIATAIICGALIIGDSLQQSLLNIVDQRIGSVTHSVTAGERLSHLNWPKAQYL